MNTVLELRQKRAILWEQAKNFLDEVPRTDGILSADDTAAYEKMERDIVALGKEIDIQERREELEKQLNAPVNTPITNPVQHPEPEKTGPRQRGIQKILLVGYAEQAKLRGPECVGGRRRFRGRVSGAGGVRGHAH